MRDPSFWQQKCVLITGASSGIGWALAKHLATRGAKLGLIARREEKLRELAAAIEFSGGQAAFAVADVTDPEQTRQAGRVLEEALGPCDVLIASAGIHRYSPGYDFRPNSANAVFATNVEGVVNAIGAVLPGMVERRRGHLVAMASIAAMLGLPEVGAYSASKAAIVTLMESLRVDLHGCNVKVTTICPGFVDTPLIADHARPILRFILDPADAARRIAWAIEHGRAEYWFPWQTWLLARLGRALPLSIYRRICSRLPKQPLHDPEWPRGLPRRSQR
jgi:short-subunit dehydrogenase